MPKLLNPTNQLNKKNTNPKLPQITVAELFAGVGGFRLGLEGYNGKSATSGYKAKMKSPFKTIFSNQWEPNKNKQIASLVYQNRFGNAGHTCKDIATLNIDDIPNHDMLVGGFPCQDYSIANRVNAGGLNGKKARSGGRFTG